MSRYWKWNQVGASAPGDSPDSIPLSWDAVYNILPNADDAIYVNNRLLVPTAYAPGGATYGVSSFYAKKDYVVATDFLDELHFDFVNEFRINQGAEDEIVQLHKMGENTVVVAKSGSWGVLSNIGYDLVTPGATLDMRELEYGQTALGAGCVAGRNVYMLVEGRGVVSLGQTEQSKIQSVDLPLSDEIEPLIKRIAWRLKDKTRMAYWDNKLYVAVPLDDGTKVGLDLVSGVYSGSVPSLKIGGGTAVAPVSLLVTGLRIGQTYQYKAGNSTKLSTGTEVIDDLDYPGGDIVTEGPFVATQTEYTLWAPPGLLATVSTAEVRTGYVDVNNAILVYDFLSQKWSGVDTGGPLMVKEFFKTSFRGVERLFFAAENGWINVIEESESGDQVQDDESETGLGWDEITSTWATRAYPLSNNRAIRPVEGLMHLATWNPSWSVNVIYNRANDLRAIDADGVEVFTRDRTKYDRPFDAEDWNVTNVNEDHGTPGRQDYSVPIGGAGLYVNEGVQLDLKQEQPWTFSIAPKKGTTVQLEVTKTQGRMQVTAVELTAVKADRRKGIVT
jgi:hypothetical protein